MRWTGLPLPGPVVGMVLLFFALVLRGGVPASLRDTSGRLLQHLMLLLVPASTAVMLHGQRVGDEWLPIVLAAVGGAAVTMAVTALTLRWLLARTTPRRR